MIPVRQSTAFECSIGPVLDADGAAVTDCVVGDFKIKKTTGNFAALNGSATLTHVSAGTYDLVLTTSDTDTVGLATIAIDDTTNACAPVHLQVMEEAVYDRDYAASATGGVNVTSWNSVALSTTNPLPNAASGASGGLLIAGSNAGTTTFNALTVTNATTLSGAVSLGSTLSVSGTTSFAAVTITATGSSSGLVITGGPTCTTTQGALRLVGGSTSGAGLSMETTDGHGLYILPAGSAKHGIYSQSSGTGASSGIYSTITGSSTGYGIRSSSIDVVANVSVGGTTTLTGAVTASNASNSITGITVASVGSDAITSTSLASSAGSEIAAAVWDLATSGHTNSGTFGEAMNAAGSAGDPWTTSLPGAYSSGTAGYILGNNLDAAITSRMATYSQPTGFLAATFPTTVASTTNITAASGITVSTNNDKTGYSLTQSFPSNFSSMSITSGGMVGVTSNIKKNQALSKFAFLMTDSTAHEPATGLTVTVSRSIDGGAFSSGALSSVTEIGSGMYYVDFSASDLNGNVILLKAVASGADTTLERVLTQP